MCPDKKNKKGKPKKWTASNAPLIHALELNLSMAIPERIYRLMRMVRKDIPTPIGSYRDFPPQWDHLIDKLDKGDSFECSEAEKRSFVHRCKQLKYVLVVRTTGEKGSDKEVTIWFAGHKEDTK